MTDEDYVEAIRDEGRKKGRDAGLREGRDAGLREGREALVAHPSQRRLGRPLIEGEHTTLRARVQALGAEQVSDLAFELDADALATWLAGPVLPRGG